VCEESNRERGKETETESERKSERENEQLAVAMTDCARGEMESERIAVVAVGGVAAPAANEPQREESGRSGAQVREPPAEYESVHSPAAARTCRATCAPLSPAERHDNLETL
jgi:hypothetical protein